MKKLILISATVAAVLGAAALAGVGLPESAHGDAGTSRTITVDGTGTVKAKPDRAQFSFGVDSRASTAREASADNARSMQQLIAALKAAGIADRDLQTEQVSVWPAADGDGHITGYTASGSVSVETSVDGAGAIVDAATAAGATTVSGPTLTVGDTDALEADALHKAVADARRKASALADAAGAGLGPVVKIVEGTAAEPPVFATAVGAAKDAATPIEPGTVDTTATVTVTFSMQ